MNKKTYYADKKVVSDYYNFRYGGRSGEYVNRRELTITKELLPIKGRILDIPCGRGRLTKILLEQGFDVIAADYSPEMINQAKEALRVPIIRADAFNLPFKDASFDCVISLRFTFHYQEIQNFFREAARIIKKGGFIIFDTYRWSPMAFSLPYPQRLGGRVFIHSQKRILQILKELNLKVITSKNCFLFSPFIYRFLPFFVAKILDRIERILPGHFSMAKFWKVEKL